MKQLLLFMIASLLLLACHKDDNTEFNPEQTSKLQAHKWYLDSTITTEKDTLVSRFDVVSPDFKYTVYSDSSYTNYFSFGDTQTAETLEYEYRNPGTIYFWDDTHPKKDGLHYTVDLLDQASLVLNNEYTIVERNQTKRAFKVTNYYHAQ